MPNETLHGQVTADLRELVGDLPAGAPLPSEADLQTKYNVSRATVRRALQTLEQDGLITTHMGRGRIVRDRRAMVYRPQAESEPRRSATMDRIMADLAQTDGRNPSQSISVSIEQVNEFVAKRLRVPVNTPVVVRRRIRSLNGEPFNINDTYYLHSIAKDTDVMNPVDIPTGSNYLIEAIIGREVRAVDEFYIRMPTPEEARRLNLSTGTPVAIHYTTGYTADDKVVRVDYSVIPGDRHVILYERVHAEDEE
jgi:DNA-binding GntR family transcriptional regulator